ncbi:MAG: universal stress protein [Motilibacteraceae bacterium]
MRENEILTAHAGNCLVAGFGHGPENLAVLREGADLARRLGAHLHVVHVVDEQDFPVDPDAADWDRVGAAHVERSESYAADVLADADVDWSWLACHGDPANCLRRLAETHSALLVVVGTRGDGVNATISRILAGSVTHRLLRHGTVPLVVVPAHRHVPRPAEA